MWQVSSAGQVGRCATRGSGRRRAALSRRAASRRCGRRARPLSLGSTKGQDDECQSHAAEVVVLARPNGHGIAYAIAEWALALLDLVGGRPEETVTRFTLAALSPGHGHPYDIRNAAPDLVEAAVRTEHREEAESAFVVIDEFAHTGGRGGPAAFIAKSGL